MRNCFLTLTGLLALTSGTLAAQDAQVAQAAQVVGYSAQTARGHATLDLHLSDGTTHQIRFRGGEIRIGNEVIGQYTPGGALETAWRALLARSDLTSPDQMLAALRTLPAEGLAELDLAGLTALYANAAVPTAPAGVAVPPMPDLDAVRTQVQNARTQVRDAIRNEIRNGIEAGIESSIDNVSPQIIVVPRAAAPPISSVPGGLLALFGTLIALSGLAFGTSFFAERQIDVMADTVQHSLGRSFFVGLFAQPLLIPALGALVIGLALTVVGILVIPFAVIAFFALLAVGLVGGYLAVARATGATFLTRRDQPISGGMNLVKSTIIGLAILMALWLPAVLFGWVPVMGTILRIAAGLATWGLVTTGFGAAILTRGGVRGTFGRRFAPEPIPFSRQLSIPDEPAAERFSTAEWLSGKAK
ncbi:MAG: hypothetical protein WD043_03360 [Gemmatimonadales bacterium]